MQDIVRHLLRMTARVTGLSMFSTLVIAAIVTVWHKLDTPQRLDSALAGEDLLYRWKWGHIFYKALGAVDAPALVLLHTPGIGASGYEMRSILEPLAEHYRVYAPDLLGFGLSDRPEIEYSAEMYIRLCRDFLREVVARPATLFASQLSCNYAVAVAAGMPELCERLVLISPVELFEGTRERQRRVHAWLEIPFVQSLLYALLSTRFAYWMLGGGMRHCKDAQEYFYATTHQFGARHAAMALLAGRLAYDASHELVDLRQPTLIIWGERALNNSRSLGSQRHLPAHMQMVHLQDAGIHVHEERPEGVVAKIRAWNEEEKIV